MTSKLLFGAWLTHQWNIQGDTTTIRGIRMLARFVTAELSFPKTAKAYGSYFQWVLKNTQGSDKRMLYILALEAAWKKWELWYYTPDTQTEQVKQE